MPPAVLPVMPVAAGKTGERDDTVRLTVLVEVIASGRMAELSA